MKFFAMLVLGAAASRSLVQLDAEKPAFVGDTGIIDALTAPKGKCAERLWLSQDELEWQMDQFSRKFDKKNYDNAVFIAGKIGAPLPKVKTWELLNGSFSFPRIRRFSDVQENMDVVEHFQDNLNLNLSNSIAVDNFIRAGKTAVGNLAAKYKDGEFANPKDFDPRADKYNMA